MPMSKEMRMAVIKEARRGLENFASEHIDPEIDTVIITMRLSCKIYRKDASSPCNEADIETTSVLHR